MAIIETNIPLPAVKRAAVKRKLSPLAQELLDTLTACKDGDSFVVPGDYRAVATVAGRMGKRLGCSIRTTTETTGSTRVWRIAAKPAKA
jgi:hypothetical protein